MDRLERTPHDCLRSTSSGIDIQAWLNEHEDDDLDAQIGQPVIQSESHNLQFAHRRRYAFINYFYVEYIYIGFNFIRIINYFLKHYYF